MNLEVGMYVRYQDKISKIIDIDNEAFSKTSFSLDTFLTGTYQSLDCLKGCKVSYNPIDLIEVGDILIDTTNSKNEVLLIDNELMVRNTGLIYDNNYYLPVKNIAIKSIVTKEQFEQVSYKVVENV